MDTFTEFKKLMAGFIDMLRREVTPQVAATMISFLTVLIIGLIILRRHSGDRYVSPRVKKAIALGHTAVGTCVKSWVLTDDRLDPTAMVNAIFEYTVDNITYKYHYLERGAVPQTLTIYYLNNPKHGFIQKRGSYLRGVVVLLLAVLAGAAAAIAFK